MKELKKTLLKSHVIVKTGMVIRSYLDRNRRKII